MQTDDNLVLYKAGSPIWGSNTSGQNCAGGQGYAVFQIDGNFVVYNGARAIWATNTGGSSSAQLVLSTQTPYIQIIKQQSILWANAYIFAAGELTLAENAYVNIGSLGLVMQSDGNLVLYGNGTAIWNTGSGGQTCGNAQCYAVFQTNGNLVVYNGSKAIWVSNTSGNSAGTLVLSSALPDLVGTGTVSTTDVGETSDGNLQGVSTLSINNGAISTYSATTLDYTASLYYDTFTVATLFDDGNQTTQNISPISTNTTTSLTGTATAWDDYDLQTDHYAIAYFVYGSYVNPLYWGSDCYADSGDCSVVNGGGYSYYVVAADIYVGSTFADQAYVPQNQATPAFNLSAYNAFLAGASPPYPNVSIPLGSIGIWVKAIGTSYSAIKLVYGIDSGPGNYPPIPYYVDLVGETYDYTYARRERTFAVRDIYGKLWNTANPLRIGERFTDMTWSPGATLPVPNGVWYCAVPEVSQTDVRIDSSSEYTDLHGGTALNLAAQVNYVEYYYATDFSLPPPSAGLSPFLTAVPGVSVTALPLWIRDTYNKCSSSTVLPAEGISLNAAKVYIDGDGGVGTGCRAH